MPIASSCISGIGDVDKTPEIGRRDVTLPDIQRLARGDLGCGIHSRRALQQSVDALISLRRYWVCLQVPAGCPYPRCTPTRADGYGYTAGRADEHPYPYPRGFLPVPAAGLPDPCYSLIVEDAALPLTSCSRLFQRRCWIVLYV